METIPFKQYPRSARNGIIFLLLGWALLILSQAVLYSKVSFIQVTIGLFCCVIVYTLKNWGRVVCIVYNIILMGAFLFNLYNLMQGNHLITIPAAINLILLILFVIATYYLSLGETAVFYKEHSKKKV